MSILPLTVAAAFVAASAAAVADVKVEKLGDDLWRVRMSRDGKWPESGMNRYGVLSDLPVLETGESLEVLKVKPSVAQVGKGFEVSFPLKADSEVYGLGDVCRTNVMRRGAKYEIWVKNVHAYIPVPVAFVSEGWGVFVNSTWRHFFDVGAEDPGVLKVSAPQGDVDFYFFTGDGYAALLDVYTRLTGRPALLPVWGYGFTYVCNENMDEFNVLAEAHTFRREGIPCDVIGLEPGWMSTNYDHTTRKDWHPDRFRFPRWAPNGNIGVWGRTEATIWPQALAGMGFKLSLWLCCDYDLFRYEEQCAAGVARKAGRQPDLRAGIPEFWEDDRITGAAPKKGKRNEPEKEFEEGKLPWFEHLKKFVDQGAQAFKLDGAWQVTEHKPDRKWANGMTTEEAHNLYPLVYDKQMARGYEDYTGKRAMVYSAGGYAGVQQYVATWAGDTGGGPKPLASLLNLAFSGHPNQSCDMQIGDPRSRHFGFLQTWSQQNNWYYWKQAWYMAPDKQAAFREYIRLRYRILPYLYTASARAARTGWPVTHPLALEFPGAGYAQCATTYMLGDSLLVSAFTDETEIPPGVWFDWWTGEKVVGPSKRGEAVSETHGGGLYVKAGAIIPTWPVKQHLEKGWNDEVVFEVWPSADGDAELYEDDGISLGYRSGAYAITPLSLRLDGKGRITFRVGERKGAFDGMPEKRRMKVRLHFGERTEECDLGLVGGEGTVWQKAAAVELKTGPDRVESPLSVPYRRVGTLRPRAVGEIKSSNWTLGCECLDRDYADFEQYKRFIAPLGIKTVRLQAGWAKSEREKGVYDLAWLDKIVDYLVAQGVNVLMETSYGNPIYKGGGGPSLSMGIPTGEEGLAAWDRWIERLSGHFATRVRDWAMWNEPDNSAANTPDLLADFNVRTAKIIRRNVPNARIAGLSLARSDPKFFGECLREMGEGAKLFDWFIYHGYEKAPESSYDSVEALKAVLAKHAPAAKMRQGENGCPSDYTGEFALSCVPWTEYSQAKWDLRRMLGDLGHDVESAVFTFCDFNHIGRGMNTKGLVRANTRHEVVGLKRAYYAVQNAVSVFDDTLSRVRDNPVKATDPTIVAYEYRKSDGRPVYVFWKSADELLVEPADPSVPRSRPVVKPVHVRPGDSFELHPIELTAAGKPLSDPVWVDLMTGRIYEFPSESLAPDGDSTTYFSVPAYDSPCLLTERSVVLAAPGASSGR